MQTLGIVDLVWKGRRIPIEKGGKFKPGGLMNTAVVLARRVDRSANFEAGEVTATTTLQRGQRLMDLLDVAEGELQVLCDTGQTYVSPDAFLTTLPEATGGEGGKIELKWAVGEMEELLNG